MSNAWSFLLTSLSLQTVRTIVGRKHGTDRTSKKRREKIEIEAGSGRDRDRQGAGDGSQGTGPALNSVCSVRQISRVSAAPAAARRSWSPPWCRHPPAPPAARQCMATVVMNSTAICTLKNSRIRASLENEHRCPVDRLFLLPVLHDYLHGEPGTTAGATPRRLSVPYVQHSGPRMGRAL